MNKFSFSRVNSILSCPKKYHDVGFESNVHFQNGLKLHVLLENYIKHGVIDDVLSAADPEFIPKIINSLALEGHERLISELRVETELVKGFIDLIIIDDKQKTVLILDLKTINDKRINEYKLDNAEQLLLYARLFRILYPQFDEYTLHIGYILYRKRAKTVKFITDPCDETELKNVFDNFMKKGETARLIVNKNLWFARPNQYCTFCKLKDKCKGVNKS